MPLIFRRRHNNQRGDTIVEVLIAMAIISLVLTGAYAITNRDLRVTQANNERSQAQQLVQKQVELLRAYAQNGATISTSDQCLQDDATLTSQCNVPAAESSPGNDSRACGAFCYLLSIAPEQGVSGVYVVTAKWDSLIGGQSYVSLDYGPAHD